MIKEKQEVDALEAYQGKWKPIDTAPKDDTWFLGLIEGIPYKCKIVMNEGNVSYQWCMHTDMASGDSYIKSFNDDGREVRTMLSVKIEPKYEPKVLSYKLGMNSAPTQWMPYNPPTNKD